MASSVSSLVSHNGCPVAPWTETAKDFQVLQKFPHLRSRLGVGVQLQLVRPIHVYTLFLNSLIHKRLYDNTYTQQLADQRGSEVASSSASSASLHGQVSLLVGGNLAHMICDAVVNASNHWLTSGKGAHVTLKNMD